MQAYWRRAKDGPRLRCVHWPAATPRGTVFIYTGRTEYAEKYGPTARDLTDAGFSVMTLDWRGQGLSDRLIPDARLGHVEDFADYQRDAAELLALADLLECPKPWMMIGHSMGGCIGLRSLVNGLPFERAVFSAPMWGLAMPPWLRPLSHVLPPLFHAVGQGQRVSPGTSVENYTKTTDFPGNMLTTDPAIYDWLQDHVRQVPEFALGGPTVDWVGRAIAETRALYAAPRPALPVLTGLGTAEEIVSIPAIRAMHAHWPSARLVELPGARHELLMEAPEHRRRFLQDSLDFLTA
ncbi:MAG: alpha/beta hydrolase [Silicimonas sp.]|nr:alpha/beta hydrolase [Silicimonas sp.]